MDIVIVGAGTSGLSCVKSIDKREDLKIHLVEKNVPPFKKYLLLDWLIGKVSDAGFFISLDQLKSENPDLELIHDKAVRINFDKRKIFFKQGEPLDFDTIILCCGVKPKRLEFDGSLKQGVHLLSQSWPPDLKKDITIFNHIVVYVETIAGIELAMKLSALSGKEIKVIAHDLDFLPYDFQQRLSDTFKSKSIDLYSGASIAEVLGESRAKAVKLSGGKFLACDTLILDTEVFGNVDIVRDSPGVLDKGVLRVDDQLKSVYDFFFVCGSMSLLSIQAHSLFCDNRDLSERQSSVIAKNIFGGSERFFLGQQKRFGEGLRRLSLLFQSV